MEWKRHRKSSPVLIFISSNFQDNKKPVPLYWDRITCGATQVDVLNTSARFLIHVHMSRSDNGRGTRRLLLAIWLSTALVSPFSRTRPPQSHHLRLSKGPARRDTILTRRFASLVCIDYKRRIMLCQGLFFKNRQKANPNVAKAICASLG